ncbi:MAG: NTP transferase domain-containing protein [Verrucomicrobia bacterium]|nr:NTP transferase domain-containing protein [Cytophagales bacterium]
MSKKTTKLLILSGGMSSRMKKALTNDSHLNPDIVNQANTLPKAMIGLGKNGRPFLDYVLFNAANAGISEILLLLNPKDTFTQAHYEKLSQQGKAWQLNIKFARQHIPADREKPLGTADAILQALNQHPDWQKSTFIVCNADNLYPVSIFEALAESEYANAMPDFDSIGYDEARVRNCAIIRKDSKGFLTDLIEKPTDEEWYGIVRTMPRIGISWNIFSFEAQEVLPFLEKTPFSVRNEKELPNTVRMMAKEKPESIFCMPVAEVIPDLTSKADIMAIQEFLEKEYGDF